jgi:hypothetical protein
MTVINMTMPEHSPLACFVKGKKLVVSIGIETLVQALIRTPEFEDDQGPRLQIKDPRAFAERLATRLEDEVDETGETHVTTLLIKACSELIEMGDWTVELREKASG